MSIRAAAGIKSSSGNRAKSMKHCFTLGCLSNASKLFSRQLYSSLYSSPPSITGPASDNAMALVLHTSMGSPHSDLPTTVRASGNPLHSFTICISYYRLIQEIENFPWIL
ncbi:unnamed protein product [Linum tenue]|uniref:Uncharacterized protein n=1 Tax=Linum tenue TaxID=586396 RepID=A0AAV0RCF7_9ROSI|nr:unnamed protein product [Linum tenue]